MARIKVIEIVNDGLHKAIGQYYAERCGRGCGCLSCRTRTERELDLWMDAAIGCGGETEREVQLLERIRHGNVFQEGGWEK